MSKPPLWEAMQAAYDQAPMAPIDADVDWTDRHGYAAEIRALRDWLVPSYPRVVLGTPSSPPKPSGLRGGVMTLPLNIARCPGFGDGPEDWLEECHSCQRRTAPGGERNMKPPPIITFFCEYHIPEDSR